MSGSIRGRAVAAARTNAVSRGLQKAGWALLKVSANLPKESNVVDLEKETEFLDSYRHCAPFTMTSVERMYALYMATKYVVQADIPGDVVECGVWRGGSAMLCARTLLELDDPTRQVYLYDTFAGMPEPTDKDVAWYGTKAGERWSRAQRDGVTDWCYSPLEEVKDNLRSTGFPSNRSVFVKGTVEQTIPATVPEQISLLRLDTDWYESTYHELSHLFPRLAEGGVLIIDDYGHWAGAREATDRYLEETETGMLLNRIDYTARIGIKPRKGA